MAAQSQSQKRGLLIDDQLVERESLEAHLEVVPEGAGEHLLGQLVGEYCGRALGGVQGVKQGIAQALFVVEYGRPSVLPARRGDRLATPEKRGEDHLVADDQAIGDEMMTVDLEAPWLHSVGVAEERHPVEPLAV